MTSVGDNESRITDAIRLGLSRADVVITTGGLGPTVDDMTRQGVAYATDRDLVFHQHLLDKIAERFTGFRSNMTENNRRQAYLPDSAILIENPVGTAPCFVVEHQEKIVISLPGVPREMKFLLAERVVPFLQDRYQLGVIKAHTLRAAGIGESALDDLIGGDLLSAGNPTVGLAAHSGVVDMRITAKADDEVEADRMIALVADKLRERVGDYIFGTDGDTIEQALIQRLQDQNGSLAISEIGIGHAISDRLREVSGADDIIQYAEVYDSPEALGQSESDIQQLAIQVAERLCHDADVLVGIVILSDPDQDRDQADSDAGTAVAVRVGQENASRVYGFGANAAEARVWTGTWALSRAWRMLGNSVG
jgi:nicotinamide-nucleotide amidase